MANLLIKSAEYLELSKFKRRIDFHAELLPRCKV